MDKIDLWLFLGTDPTQQLSNTDKLGSVRLLRSVLSQVSDGCPHHGLDLSRGPHGKPQLVDCCQTRAALKELRFNLSHTEGATLIAVTIGREVGVDIESIRPIPQWKKIARRYFRPEEVLGLGAAEQAPRQPGNGDPEMPRNFLQLWTQKEAILKCTGQPLSRWQEFARSTDLQSFWTSSLQDFLPATFVGTIALAGPHAPRGFRLHTRAPETFARS